MVPGADSLSLRRIDISETKRYIVIVTQYDDRTQNEKTHTTTWPYSEGPVERRGLRRVLASESPLLDGGFGSHVYQTKGEEH